MASSTPSALSPLNFERITVGTTMLMAIFSNIFSFLAVGLDAAGWLGGGVDSESFDGCCLSVLADGFSLVIEVTFVYGLLGMKSHKRQSL
jgi:hypothetical protein